MGTGLEILMALIGIGIAGYLLFNYSRSGSKSLIVAAVGWGLLSLQSILKMLGFGAPVREFFIYGFALMISAYVVLNVMEDYPEKAKFFALYMLIPMSHVLYRSLEHAGIKLPPGIGGLAGDSGIMLLVTAYISYRTFGKITLAVSFLPMASVLLFYKLLQGTYVGFALMTIGALIFAVGTLKMIRIQLFKGQGAKKEANGFMGLVLADYTHLNELKVKYSDYPVLLITRERAEYPSLWTVFYLTTVAERNSIPPTSLEKLRHVIVQYLREARSKGSTGVVLMEGFEYLHLYNSETALLKFLSDIRDHAIATGGVIFLALSRDALGPRELAVLERISDHVYR